MNAQPQNPNPSPPSPAANELQPVHLEWSMSRDGDHLNIQYNLTNRSQELIYVADRLFDLHSGKRVLAPTRVIVAPGDQDDTVRFVRGIVEVTTEVEFDYPPAAVPLAPGQVHTDTTRVPLPLQAWHNYAPPDRLKGVPRRALLEIAYLTAEGEWGTVPLANGSNMTIPQLGYFMRSHRLARTPPRAIP